MKLIKITCDIYSRKHELFFDNKTIEEIKAELIAIDKRSNITKAEVFEKITDIPLCQILNN